MIQDMLRTPPPPAMPGHTGGIWAPSQLHQESIRPELHHLAAVFPQGPRRALLTSLLPLAIWGWAEKAPEERLLRQPQNPHPHHPATPEPSSKAFGGRKEEGAGPKVPRD